MANKKISQLTTAANVGVGDYFPVAVAAGGSNFTTKKAETETVATYILSPVPSAISQIGFTGTNDVYFDKSNWVDTSAAGGNTHAYLMVNKTDGQLTTGSGIGNPVGGDNMGNCVATTTLNMQNNNITNVASIFFNTTASTVLDEDGQNLVMQAARDMTVSGIRHVHISGQALSLASAPVSGDVTFSKGGLTIPDNQGITGDNIVINKTSRHLPHEADFTVDWSDSNIQHDTLTDATSPAYTFSEALAGQTLTMYVKNNHSAPLIPTFTSGSTVLWGGTGGPPHLDNGRTNVYAFACYDGMLFASAITGYVNP